MASFTKSFLLLLAFTAFVVIHGSVSSFDDAMLFHMRWTAEEDMKKQGFLSTSTISVRSSRNEEYNCHLPTLTPETTTDAVSAYKGPSPHELIRRLYASKTPCTYRIETYWAYELCHGKYMQQYHEEKDSLKRVKRQEYYLGSYVESYAKEMESAYNVDKPPTRMIESLATPYVPVKYIQGTVCDVTGNARTTTVLYICDDGGRGQMESIAETASCEYEVVVPVQTLCQHPAFRPPTPKKFDIVCSSARDRSPKQPVESVKWKEEQQSEFNQQYASWQQMAKQEGIPDNVLRSSIQPQIATQLHLTSHRPPPTTHQSQSAPPADQALITVSYTEELTSICQAFLSGEQCLYGGSGWWKHEYCHMKRVLQFHETKEERVEILLGVWDEGRHRAWIKQHSHKAPVRDGANVFQVSHFYSAGSICEETGVGRVIEVKLRCVRPATVENTQSANAVSISLSEPKTCEYVLRVESQMFCDALQSADHDGVLGGK